MTLRRAVLALAALAVATGAAAAREPAKREPPPTFHKATRGGEVTLKAPAALVAWPAFRDSLVQGDTAKLNGFLRHAGSPPGKGPVAADRKSWREIGYELAGSTARLVSVIRTDESYTGGAHPIHTLSGVVWDKAAKRRLTLNALFRPDMDATPIDKALCAAMKAAKAEREGAAPLDGKLWKCPAFSQSQAALAPSTVGGKAGGLIVLINPYEVGPYVEGDYRLLLPQAAFRRALRPAYLAEFAGEPSEAAEALANPGEDDEDDAKPSKPAKPPARAEPAEPGAR